MGWVAEMALYPLITTTLGFLAIVAFLAGIALGSALPFGGRRVALVRMFEGQERHPITWAWAVAVVASTGSLYLSEIVGLMPCSFCWYQRIAMYPLVIVLGIGALRRDAAVWRYALPLSAVGLLIAIYHVTIQWQPSLDVGACSSGAPCSGRYLAVFGFVTIPTMAGAAFVLIAALLLLVRLLEGSGSQRDGASLEP